MAIAHGFNMDDDDLYPFQIRIRHGALLKTRPALPETQRTLSKDTVMELVHVQLACPVLRSAGYPGGNHNLPKTLTHFGQNRGQKTGPPVKRRNGDEIVLLSRDVALPAAESSSQAKSPKWQPAVNWSLGHIHDTHHRKSPAMAK